MIIWILNSDSGVKLLYKSFLKTDADEDIVSGFLTSPKLQERMSSGEASLMLAISLASSLFMPSISVALRVSTMILPIKN